MTTILYFFWDGFSGVAEGATLVGTWSHVLTIQSPNRRIEIQSPNKRL